MSTGKRINSHRQMVMAALSNNLLCREDDLELFFEVLCSKGVNLSENQKYSIKHSGVEFKTLLRERQRFQSKGEFLPSNPEVLKKRKKLASEYTEHYSE
jgi:hypothetical protein